IVPPPRPAGPLTAVAVTVDPDPDADAADADSKATARATGAGATAVLPPAPPGTPPAKPERTWKARHWAVILAAPLLLVVGGAIAYAKLTEHAPIVKVPDVVDRDVFSAASIL